MAGVACTKTVTTPCRLDNRHAFAYECEIHWQKYEHAIHIQSTRGTFSRKFTGRFRAKRAQLERISTLRPRPEHGLDCFVGHIRLTAAVHVLDNRGFKGFHGREYMAMLISICNEITFLQAAASVGRGRSETVLLFRSSLQDSAIRFQVQAPPSRAQSRLKTRTTPRVVLRSWA